MVPVPVLEESREPGMDLSSHRLVWKVLMGHSPCGHGIRYHKRKKKRKGPPPGLERPRVYAKSLFYGACSLVAVPDAYGFPDTRKPPQDLLFLRASS